MLDNDDVEDAAKDGRTPGSSSFESEMNDSDGEKTFGAVESFLFDDESVYDEYDMDWSGIQCDKIHDPEVPVPPEVSDLPDVPAPPDVLVRQRRMKGAGKHKKKGKPKSNDIVNGKMAMTNETTLKDLDADNPGKVKFEKFEKETSKNPLDGSVAGDVLLPLSNTSERGPYLGAASTCSSIQVTCYFMLTVLLTAVSA